MRIGSVVRFIYPISWYEKYKDVLGIIISMRKSLDMDDEMIYTVRVISITCLLQHLNIDIYGYRLKLIKE